MENQNYTGPSPLISGGGGDTEGDEKHDLEDNKDNTLHREENEDEAEVGEKTKMAYSETDPTKVKFTNMLNHGAVVDGKSEAKVDIENVQLSFAGMGKEELMKYADDPFWVRLRWILFIFFWFIWAAMLVGAILIVVMTPGCPPPPQREWSHKGVIYQVFPRSFKDTDGDGNGDLRGVIEKLDYIKSLGVNAIWLNPIYKSPMKDAGYDISDFTDIDPRFGNMSDFEDLVKEAHSKDIRVILDFVPNHSSDQHPWFVKSLNSEGKYADYYIWKTNQLPSKEPNNWVSVFGGPAWTWNSTRNQFYYHQFHSSQPDLNLRNEDVREELRRVLWFWLEKDVDGFRVDAIKHMFESESLENEPPSNNTSVTIPESYEAFFHNYTTNMPENLELLREWRELVDNYTSTAGDGRHRVLLAEAYDNIDNVMEYYGNDSYRLADFPFNFFLLPLTFKDGAQAVYKAVSLWLQDGLSESKWPNWVLGNHDNPRLASRVGDDLVDAYHMIVMLIGGTPITYYGEEIGMPNGEVSFNEQQDPLGKSYSQSNYLKYTRDLERTPMQWNNESDAGFSTGIPWLPVGQSCKTINVEAQTGQPTSHLEFYKKLVKMREEPAIVYGDLHFLMDNDTDVFAFVRVKKGSPGVAVIINFSRNSTTIDLTTRLGKQSFTIPEDGTLEMKSSLSNPESGLKTKVQLDKLDLEGRDSLVVNFVPSFG